MPSTSVTFYVTQKKVIDLFNSILLRLHNGDMEEEYDLIADALDSLVDSETQNQYSAGQQYEDERERKSTMSAEDTKRILITGSRDWTDERTILEALTKAWNDLGRDPNAILVQGDCHLGGADIIARDFWRQTGMPVESHPAAFTPEGRCLGPERNKRMVDLGADMCLAFPLSSSRGTRNCMRLAREAKIPLRVYEG